MAQKFTRPITREVELAGERIALTFTDAGISARIVGTRSEPKELDWSAVVLALSQGAPPVSGEELAAAVKGLRPGKASKSSAKSSNPPEPVAGPPDDLGSLLARLEQWLAAHRKRFLTGLRPGANEKDLHALEAQLGVEVPEELRTLLKWHNGQNEEFAGNFEQAWFLMGTEAIAAAYPELLADGAGNGHGTGFRPGWIPFLDDDGGDYLCLDTTQPGAPVREFRLGNHEHPVIAPTLAAWLRDFVKAVEAGDYHEEPERGTFLKKTSAKD